LKINKSKITLKTGKVQDVYKYSSIFNQYTFFGHYCIFKLI
jgi:hypothetical protein